MISDDEMQNIFFEIIPKLFMFQAVEIPTSNFNAHLEMNAYLYMICVMEFLNVRMEATKIQRIVQVSKFLSTLLYVQYVNS